MILLLLLVFRIYYYLLTAHCFEIILNHLPAKIIGTVVIIIIFIGLTKWFYYSSDWCGSFEKIIVVLIVVLFSIDIFFILLYLQLWLFITVEIFFCAVVNIISFIIHIIIIHSFCEYLWFFLLYFVIYYYFFLYVNVVLFFVF